MKYILLLALAAAIIGGGWYLYTQNAAAPTDETPEEETAPTGSETAEEEAAEEESVGSDAGMEFPTVDGDTGLSIDPDARVFNISGTNHDFDVKEIRVREGDTVTINFTSASGFHDFVLDEFNAATDRVRDGGSSSVTFVADRKGTFEYYCSVGNHRAMGMVGTFIVE